MKKILMIFIFLFFIGCNTTKPIDRSNLVNESYEGCEIIYQDNTSDFNTVFVIIHNGKLKVISIRDECGVAIIFSEAVVHGIDIKVKNNKEIIKDINMILQKYSDKK